MLCSHGHVSQRLGGVEGWEGGTGMQAGRVRQAGGCCCGIREEALKKKEVIGPSMEKRWRLFTSSDRNTHGSRMNVQAG